MCGRYSRSSRPKEIADFLNATFAPKLRFDPSYNVAPTQNAPIVRVNIDGKRELILAKWGLIPVWADDASIGNRMINARCESAASKPAYRGAFAKRRCIVPADGFYEWEPAIGKTKSPKQPWYFHRADSQPLLLAGLWERWDKGPEPIESFTILTTDAGPFVRPVHERSPVILEPEDVGRWLDSSVSADNLQSLLAPVGDGLLTGHRVSPRVNTPRNNDPTLIKPL